MTMRRKISSGVVTPIRLYISRLSCKQTKYNLRMISTFKVLEVSHADKTSAYPKSFFIYFPLYDSDSIYI